MNYTSWHVRVFAPVLTLLVVPLVTALDIPNPALIFMMAAIYFSFAGGILSGSISVAVTILYMAYFFSIPGHFLQYSPDNFKRILLICVTMPLVVVMVGILKERLEAKTIQLDRQRRELSDQLVLAGKVQKMMLQGDYDDNRLSVRTLYSPAQIVSGDYYLYRWTKAERVFSGCVLDVTGHGMATALQTAAISTIVSDEMDSAECWSVDMMNRLNSKLGAHLAEGSFVAMIVFSLDFEKRLLTCVAGGINHFLVSTRNDDGWMTLPGSFVGIVPSASFECAQIPFQPGDTFYFVTDGIADRISRNAPSVERNFDDTVEWLSMAASDSEKADDCAAICIAIKYEK